MVAAIDRWLRVRVMEEEDLSQVMRIERAGYDFCWSEQIFRDCLRAGYCCLVLAEDDDVFGYCVLMVGPYEGHVLNICLDESVQGKGWARHLMHEMIDICRRTGAADLFLEVRPSNPVAQGLYRSLGFNEVGVRPGYYKAKNGREDAIVMALPL